MMPTSKKTWTMELPWLVTPSSSRADEMTASHYRSTIYSNNHSRQLQYWFEQACHIMVLDPGTNPMGLPILKYLNETPSLLHAIQSLSAAHENYTGPRAWKRVSWDDKPRLVSSNKNFIALKDLQLPPS